MLAKKYRLSKRNDFESIFKNGKKAFSKFFGIRFKLNDLENPRITVVVSNKVSKSAVKRNRIKRQVRAIVKPTMTTFKQNFDIIINVLSPILEAERDTIEGDLLNLLKKNNII